MAFSVLPVKQQLTNQFIFVGGRGGGGGYRLNTDRRRRWTLDSKDPRQQATVSGVRWVLKITETTFRLTDLWTISNADVTSRNQGRRFYVGDDWRCTPPAPTNNRHWPKPDSTAVSSNRFAAEPYGAARIFKGTEKNWKMLRIFEKSFVNIHCSAICNDGVGLTVFLQSHSRRIDILYVCVYTVY